MACLNPGDVFKFDINDRVFKMMIHRSNKGSEFEQSVHRFECTWIDSSGCFTRTPTASIMVRRLKFM